MFFFTGYDLISIIGLIVLVAVLILLNEITRRSKVMSLIFYGLVPVVLLTCIALGVVGSPSSKTWFGTVKTISALAGVWGFLIIRHTKAGETRFATVFPVAILGINIAEAVYRDIEVFMTYKTLTVDEAGLNLLGGYWNLFNAAAGVLLLVTMTGWVGIRVAKTKSRDMVWPDQLWFWIVAYDLWNAAYCYNCISTRSMYAGIALLISCTVAEAFLQRGVWLQHRAQTLALFGMFSLGVDYVAMPAFSIEATYNPVAWGVLSVAAFLFNLGVFIYMLYTMKRTHRNPYREELYTNSTGYQKNLSANGLR